jgi:cyclopropane-fatty-acyl-phospholipid synthase
MSFVATIIGTAEWVPLPDVIVRAAIHRLCSRTAAKLATGEFAGDRGVELEFAARIYRERGRQARIAKSARRHG